MILVLFTIIPTFLLAAIYFSYFLFMRQYSKRGATWRSGRVDADVSLIIATYNEEATLPSKLKNILEQDFPRNKLELVLVDSGSTDATPRIFEEFIEQNPNLNTLFIREKERLGKSHALNIAYPKASGEIKIISDSDSLLERTSISRIVSNFSDPNIGAAFGWQVLLNPDENSTTLLEKSYKNIWSVLRRGESILDSTPLFDGELSAYKASLIEPLPENKSGDDARMANIIRRKGYRAVCDSSAIFYEYAPPDSSARSIQKVRRAQGLIRVFWDFKGCMFKKEYGAYGRLILPMEFFMHCIFPTLWLFLIGMFLTSLALTSVTAFLLVSVLGLLLLAIGNISSDSRYSHHLKKVRAVVNLGLTFLSSQIFLFYATVLWISGRSLHKWQKVEGVREKWKAGQQLPVRARP
jgi:biofilm PGA synthesis N-glycosyltransferase PgaC